MSRVPDTRHCLMLSAQDSSSFLDSSPVTRWLWMWQSWRQKRKMRDESEIAIILTSPSESQRVHCPGKLGWQGEGARALVWPRYLSSDTAKQTWRKGISLKEFCSMFLQVRSSSISMENIQTLQIKSNSYSKSPSGFTLEKTLYCLSQCCLRPDNNLQFQNILTPQLSLSALAICLSWKQFIVNNYSRIVILKLARAQLYQAPILQQKQHEDVN